MKKLNCLLAVAMSLNAAPPLSIEAQFAQLRKSPPELYAFLLRMPKGGDLHNHLGGASSDNLRHGLERDAAQCEHGNTGHVCLQPGAGHGI